MTGWRRALPWRLCLLLAVLFALAELTVIHKRPARENVTERQGQTAGMIRLYCRHPERHFLQSPQLPFGLRPFNIEFSVVEWLEGKIARTIDGPNCDSVEVVARVIAIMCSAAALLIVFQIANHLLGPVAGLISSFCLATDGLWVRFASYTMVDSRMVACGLFAIYLSLTQRRRWSIVGAALFWFLTISQKPQAFAFIGPFYVVLDVVFYFLRRETQFFSAHRLRGYGSLTVGLLFAALYFIYSNKLNLAGDLPWLTWTGPKLTNWMFGDWAERLQFAYYKSQLLEWIRKSALVFTLPAVLFLIFRKTGVRKLVTTVVLLSFPFFIGRLLHTFIFLNVFKVHDYYALPQNAFSALTRGLVLGMVVQFFLKNGFLSISKPSKNYLGFAAVIVSLFIALPIPAFQAWARFHDYATNLENPQWVHYEPEWGAEIFPANVKRAFVVVAQASRGRDYLYLYFSKQEGHIWCAFNKELAPRAFWKAEGVQYVAWAEGPDPKTDRQRWIVRTMDEEMALARKMGWSSDINDVWAGRSMAEWASVATHKLKDPCEGAPSDLDPRNW